jgi:hypothetical protein
VLTHLRQKKNDTTKGAQISAEGRSKQELREGANKAKKGAQISKNIANKAKKGRDEHRRAFYLPHSIKNGARGSGGKKKAPPFYFSIPLLEVPSLVQVLIMTSLILMTSLFSLEVEIAHGHTLNSPFESQALETTHDPRHIIESNSLSFSLLSSVAHSLTRAFFFFRAMEYEILVKHQSTPPFLKFLRNYLI